MYLKHNSMKTSKTVLLLSFLAVFALAACQKPTPSTDENSTPVKTVSTDPITEATPETTPITTIDFKEVEHVFGEVPKGDVAKYKFTFKNTGTAPLVIEEVKPSCSCTVPTYSKEPIAPGETGFVETSMEAKNIGIFKKSVTVTMNTDPRVHILNFSGEVVE